MRLRNEVEAVLRSWDAHERARGANPIIDYDFHPTDAHVKAAGSRLEVFERLCELQSCVDPVCEREIGARLTADLAYLRALMGHREPLPDYLRHTQGCAANG